MKILATRVEQFIHSIDAEIRAVLVYGTDNGLVRERTNHIVSLFSSDPSDPFKMKYLQFHLTGNVGLYMYVRQMMI